ncbi:MAG: metal-dependent hydrolase [Halobacteriales archaeon]
MNNGGHVLNAVLAIGIGYVLEPSGDVPTFVTIAKVLPAVLLGALFPDVDTSFGTHRKTLLNFFVLGLTLAYPIYFDNLQFVWLGIATHFVLDLVGTRRGLALLYPWDAEFALPVGIKTSSLWSVPVTLLVTSLELAAFAGIVWLVLPGPDQAALDTLFRGTTEQLI